MPREGSSFDPDLFLAKVGAGKAIANYRKGESVYDQGDPADAVYFIQNGKVKISVVSRQGREAVVALLDGGDFFGEGCLAGQPLRTASVVAMEASAIVRIQKGAIVRMLQDEPEFSEVFTAHLLARSIRVEEDLIDQLFNSSEKRLARLLLLLANFGKEGAPTPVIPKVGHQLLADMVGTTRARISSFMNKFKRLGFIDYNGTLQVHNSLLSVVLNDKKSIGASIKNGGTSKRARPGKRAAAAKGGRTAKGKRKRPH